MLLFDIVCNFCYIAKFMGNGRCYCQFFACCVRCWDNILATRCYFVTDILSLWWWPLLWLMLCHCGRWNHICYDWCCCPIQWTKPFFECFCYIRYNSYLMWMADVIAIVADVVATIAICFIVVDVITTCCWLMLLPNMWWLMLLPNMWLLMLLPSVADGMATLCNGLMLLPCDRWNNHMVGMWTDLTVLVADGTATESIILILVLCC